MEMKLAVGLVFAGVAMRRQPERQRYPEQAPAPHHQPQLSAVEQERHAGAERAEALAQEPFGSAVPLLLGRAERTPREAARPVLNAVPDLEIDAHRNIVASLRKAHNRGRDTRQQAGA